MNVRETGKAAENLFLSGWNCSEAVFLAVCRQAGQTDCPVRLMTGLGNGLGGSEGTCGALTAAVVALGLQYGRRNPDEAAKQLAYAKAGELYAAFCDCFGATQCCDLCLAKDKAERKRICTPIVGKAAQLAAEILSEANGRGHERQCSD